MKPVPRIELICARPGCNNVFMRMQCQIDTVIRRKPETKLYCSSRCRSLAVGQLLRNDFEYKERQRQLIKSKGNIPPLHKGENHWNWKGGISKDSRGQDYR